jgi:hypothetical protein
MTALPPSDALTTASPLVVDDVRVAVYDPLFWSAAAVTAPRVEDSVTVPPLFPSDAPCASFRTTVTTEVEVPFAAIEDGEALTVDS